MNIQTLTDYFIQYGAFFIYLIVLLEYMNLPGFPAGVIMPLSGIWAAKGEISFPIVMVLTVLAGLTGSWILYLLGRLGGPRVMGFYFKKFPKHQAVIEEKMEFLREKGSIGVFVSKLLPMVRTLISIPAGYLFLILTQIISTGRYSESRRSRRTGGTAALSGIITIMRMSGSTSMI